jgi:FMN-dependent NADH-azoreductase
MREILLLICGPRGDASISQSFGEEVAGLLTRRHPDARIVRRNLEATPLPGAAYCNALVTPDAGPAPFAHSDTLIQELEAADALIIATPMHNYTVPAALKAWIDHVVRIRRTFASTPSGKAGLLRDRPVFLIVASGGWFTEPAPNGAPAQPDFLTPYMRAVLNTIGIADIRIVTLEGVARGPEMVARALAKARDQAMAAVNRAP